MRPPSLSRPKKKANFQKPCVVFQPQAVEGMQAGFNKLVNLIRPTLGPLPHSVAIEPVLGRDKKPELLDSGGTIARRIVQIQDRDEDVGLMYLRHALWKLQESEGDGTATAAVLFQSIFNQGRRYVTAGGNAMILRAHLEEGMRIILKEIEKQTTHLYGKQKLAGLARTICYDDDLAKMLGEVFDVIGAFGRLEVRKGSGLELIREYTEGMYWDNGLVSREMGNADFGLRANLENSAIVISDLEIDSPEQLVPLLTLCVKNNIKQVLLVSATLSDRAMGILMAKPNRERVFVVAVKTPGMTIDAQHDAMEDLAILTGGHALLNATGTTIEGITLDDLGYARRMWADKEFFGIIGGKGDPRVLRQHIAHLRELYKNIHDAEDRKRLLTRMGKLIGGSASLHVGGISPTDVEDRVELAKRTADAMRGAMSEGVVPGGGVALLNCREALRPCLKNAKDADERAAYNILLQALEAPFRAIVENAGFWPGKIMAEVDRLGSGYGYDVLARQVVNMNEVGLFDTAPVVKGAVRCAIAGAALALSTEAIVHIKNPPEGLNT